VSGTITFDGGRCPAAGTIYFFPIETAQGADRHPGMGQFDVDGRFTVSSAGGADGLVPGTYRVTIECWKTPPMEDNPETPEVEGSEGESYVPADYRPADLIVEPGARGKLTVTYDVPR